MLISTRERTHKSRMMTKTDPIIREETDYISFLNFLKHFADDEIETCAIFDFTGKASRKISAQKKMQKMTKKAGLFEIFLLGTDNEAKKPNVRR